MANQTELESLPKASSGGGTERYPWHDWLNGRVWEITRGDYNITEIGFRSVACTAAGKRGLRAKIRKQPDGAFLLQSVPRG